MTTTPSVDLPHDRAAELDYLPEWLRQVVDAVAQRVRAQSDALEVRDRGIQLVAIFEGDDAARRDIAMRGHPCQPMHRDPGRGALARHGDFAVQVTVGVYTLALQRETRVPWHLP